MASEGLLGFIKGVSGTIEEEYKRQNDEASEIRKEGRAEERAIRAEQRRIAAEKQVAEYNRQLALKYKPQELAVDADFERGLLESGQDPDLIRKRKEAEQEAGLIDRGLDPTLERAKAQEEYRAERAAAGTSSELIEYDQKNLSEAAAARMDDAVRQGRSQDLSDIEEEGPLYKTGTGPSKSEVGVSFTLSEATSQLKSDLSANHGIDLSAIRTRVNDPMKGGSRIQDLRNGEDSLGNILNKPEPRNQLREEIAFKLHNATEKRLKQAAKSKDITSLDQVTPLSDLIAERTDQTLAALDKAYKLKAEGKFTAETPEQLRRQLAKAYGEPSEEGKQSTAFRSMWAAFNKALTD